MNLWLADPRGFCAGVERAVALLEVASAQALTGLAQYPLHSRSNVSVAAQKRSESIQRSFNARESHRRPRHSP